MTVQSWPEVRIRFVGKLNPSKSEVSGLSKDTEVTFLPMDAIGEDGSIRLDATRSLATVDQGYTYFRDGDVAVAKITPCFENGKGALMAGLLGGVGFGTTELIVVRPDHRRITGQFLQWLFTSTHFRNSAEAAMYGAGGQKRVPDDFVRDFVVLLPTLAEQSVIAAFLDCETGKIDALVAEQERLIALLKEKRQAIISHAVTKGLNSNAPMKDSGVVWLGEVPTNWVVVRVKTCALLITSGPRGWSERISDNGVLFIQSGDLDDDLRVRTDEAKRVSVSPDAEALRSQLQDGDVVVCITGAKTGNVGLFHGDGAEAYINQHLSLVRPNHRIRSRFLGYVLKGNPGQLYFDTSLYGLKQGLSLEDVKSAPVALPPLSEQDRIVAFVDNQIMRLDVLETEATRAITLLRERRAALISAAVTSKIDVRDTVPATQDAA